MVHQLRMLIEPLLIFLTFWQQFMWNFSKSLPSLLFALDSGDDDLVGDDFGWFWITTIGFLTLKDLGDSFFMFKIRGLSRHFYHFGSRFLSKCLKVSFDASTSNHGEFGSGVFFEFMEDLDDEIFDLIKGWESRKGVCTLFCDNFSQMSLDLILYNTKCFCFCQVASQPRVTRAKQRLFKNTFFELYFFSQVLTP